MCPRRCPERVTWLCMRMQSRFNADKRLTGSSQADPEQTGSILDRTHNPTLIYSRVAYTRKGVAHKRKGVGVARAGHGMHRQH